MVGQRLDQLQPTSAPLLTELMEPCHDYARLMEHGLGMLQSVPVSTSAVTNVLMWGELNYIHINIFVFSYTEHILPETFSVTDGGVVYVYGAVKCH